MTATSDGGRRVKTRKKGPRFVPVEDVPGPGLSPRARELVALLLIGASLYALLSLATFDRSAIASGVLSTPRETWTAPTIAP